MEVKNYIDGHWVADNLKGMPSAKTCETNKGSQCKQDMSKM